MRKTEEKAYRVEGDPADRADPAPCSNRRSLLGVQIKAIIEEIELQEWKR